MFKLALFYALLALPTLVLVQSALLVFEYQQLRSGIAGGSLERAAQRGGAELAAHWVQAGSAGSPDGAFLQLWLDQWVLRLQQPRGGLTQDESYLLLELPVVPLSAAMLAPDGREMARSHGDDHRSPALPTPAQVALALAGTNATSMESAQRSATQTIARVLAPVRSASGAADGVLFVELRLQPAWRHLLVDSSFESSSVLAFLIIFGLASSIFLAGWVTRRLNRIARAATAWSRGDFSRRIGDRSHDELGRVSTLLDRMAIDLKGLLRSRAQLATLAERQRLARDLHDTVKQKAFALNLQLATVRRILATTPGAERLEPAQRLTQQIQQELAQILDELRASDTDLPLPERLRMRATEWAHTSAVKPHFDLQDVPLLADGNEESLLRIVDEALSNVLRHSGANRIDLILRHAAGRIELVIADNGCGTPQARAPGMGLGNMRERAQALPAGRFELAANPGGGTRITISFAPESAPV